jgi:pyruvate ferredoxin oxidoreductase gamma subunit
MKPQLPLEIRWHGRGGQGVVTASRILATAGLKAGHYMQSLPDFGAERSGAPIAAHTRIGESPPVERGPIDFPDVVIILDASLIGQVDVTAGLKEPGAVVLNIRDNALLPDMPLKSGDELWRVDASEIGMRLLGRNLPNTPVLGAFAKAVPALPLETIAEALKELMSETFSEKIIAANLQALREGFESAMPAPSPTKERAHA